MTARALPPSSPLLTVALNVIAVAGTLWIVEGDALAAPAYIRSSTSAPWGSTSNEQAMDTVFGAGAWDDLRYETVNAGLLLSPAYTFIYMEGSDSNASELNAFVMANQAAIEAWVSAGGTLFMNAGPNEGGVMNWGFGGITCNYPDFPVDPGMPADASHPIFNGPFLPIAMNWTGSSYAHASVSGPGLVPLVIDSDGGNPNLGELDWGSGRVMFGGFTTANFWTPMTESQNLRANIIAYLAAGDSDMDGLDDFEDNCNAIFNPMQEDEDADGVGDVCDACLGDPGNDVDFDAVCAAVDNCPIDANPLQENADADALGDLCDPCPGDVGNDPDADEICAAMDNCPDAYNPTQIDQDGDGAGAVCDACPLDPLDDGDADGLCANDDNCPAIANVGQEDVDMDDVGDLCDACPDDDDMVSDVDSDGLCATDDNCPSVANADQADADGDTRGDACDPCPDDAENDIDADDVCAGVDNCPELSNPNQADEDGDGIGDACDTDEGTSTDAATSSGGVDETGPGPDTDETGAEPTTGVTPETGGETGDGSTGDTGDTAGQSGDGGGCSCTSSGSTGTRGSAWWLALLVGAGLRRRRRAA